MLLLRRFALRDKQAKSNLLLEFIVLFNAHMIFCYRIFSVCVKLQNLNAKTL